MDAQVRTILGELREHLTALYGERLKQLVLFGSQARGDAEPGSDIDVLVVLAGPVDAMEEDKRTSDMLYDLMCRHNYILISCIFGRRAFCERAQSAPSQCEMGGRRGMMPEQAKLLLDARDNVRVDRILTDEGYYGIAVARAYYAMFYIAQAFLLGEDMAFSKHSGTIAAFGQYFANPERVPKRLHGILIEAEKLWLTGEYGHTRSVSVAQAEAQIAPAEEFVPVAERLIGSLSPPTTEAT